ncbi:MAG: lipid-A-disaccharide synthase [Candidatus Omnitrophica bacterium]|nr:lipid-A-disaccharide synthase [Candidatus Omnitrophota bacterium]
MTDSPKIMIVAGEESGDMRAAPLVRAIKTLMPGATFSGIGGERSKAAGVTLIANITDLAVIGFVEVVQNFFRIKKVFDLTVEHARTTQPDLAILVDYPGFNLRLAKKLKGMGIKIVYYVSPQVWAWKESRIKLIKKCVDRMIVLFPFEKELYAKHGFSADFAGHPLAEEAHAQKGASQFIREIGLDERKKIIGLVPGSREKEITRHLPVMLKALAKIKTGSPDSQFLLLKAKNISPDVFRPLLEKSPVPVTVTEEYYNGLNACDICMVCSGTATLETALMEKPMVVIYKTSWLTYFLAKLVIKIPYIALVNIVAGKKIVPELLQNNASPEKISKSILSLLKDSSQMNALRKELRTVRSRLGSPGASIRAAKVIVEEIRDV